jgi:Ca-activated chloride channel family protein
MRFEAPALLWALLLVPVALALYVVVQRGRGRHAARFTNLDLLPNLAPLLPGWRRHVPAALYLVALAAVLVALARPQAVLAVRKEEATVVLVMDTSASMHATDVAPSRLAAAQAAARRFLEAVPPAVRVGVVAFSAGAEVLATPGDDRQTALAALDRFQTRPATAMGDALELAVAVAQAHMATETPTATAGPSTPRPATTATPAGQRPAPPAAILLLSDGAQTAGRVQPLDAAAAARRLGIPVHTISLGTPNGVIETPDAPGSGQMLPVPPDEPTLRQIAEVTGGRFFTAPTAADLRAVYEGLAARVDVVQEEREVTAALAGAGVVLLTAGCLLALVWFNRFP